MKYFGVLLVLLGSFGSSLWAEERPQFPFIAASGDATVEVKPDEVELTLRLLAFDEQSGEALAELNTVVKTVLETLEKAGVKEEQITAGDLQKRTIRTKKEGSYRELEIAGYEMRRRIVVMLDKVDAFPELAASLTRVDGLIGLEPSFEVSNKEEVDRELLAKACADARRHGELLAAGLGVKLGKPDAVRQVGRIDSGWATYSLDEIFLRSGGEGSTDPFASGLSRKETSFFVPTFIEREVSVQVIFRMGGGDGRSD